jgi:hypothetical protein
MFVYILCLLLAISCLTWMIISGKNVMLLFAIGAINLVAGFWGIRESVRQTQVKPSARPKPAAVEDEDVPYDKLLKPPKNQGN